MNPPESKEPFEGEAFVDQVPPNRFMKFLGRFLQIEVEREPPENYPAFRSAQNNRSNSDID